MVSLPHCPYNYAKCPGGYIHMHILQVETGEFGFSFSCIDVSLQFGIDIPPNYNFSKIHEQSYSNSQLINFEPI